MGDAAHPMVPFLGQGGCLAIEDAYCLSSLIKKIKDLDQMVNVYDQMRNKRGRWIQKRSRLQGLFNHVSNPVLTPVRNIITKISMRSSVTKIHSYDLNEELSLKINSQL